MRAALVEQREIAPEVRHFLFETPGLPQLDFSPGQFVSLTSEIAGRKITRAYSICSPPSGNRFELCLNRVKEGVFSPRLFEMLPGGTVELSGPFGYFTPREPLGDSVMIATGTGIAPYRSMLNVLLPRRMEAGFTLLFGVRHEEGLLYKDEWEALARQYANFRFWPSLSSPGNGWTGRCGHVQQHVREACGARRDIDVYICGLKAMVDDVRAMLKQMNFDRRRIIHEKYD